MSFIWPMMLFSLLLVPLLVAAYVWLPKRRAQKTAALGTMGLLQTRSGQQLGRRRHLPFVLFLLAITLLLVGFARPEMVVDLPRVEGTVILAFDVSNSMIADDLEPSRMEAAKSAARTFVENQPPTIQIGVVAFSNGGLVIQPPTNVAADVVAAIDRLSPQGGTSLGHGIFTSLNAIAGERLALEEGTLEGNVQSLDIGYFGSAVIVLLSDGENTAQPDPLDVAQLSAEAGVRIFPIGIGSPEGAVIEIDGFSVATALDEALLQEVASLTNGTYFYAEDEADLQEIYDTIDLQLTIKGDKMEITSIIAGISLLLLLMGSALSMLWFGRVP
ncbi:MAG: VWA domain-containing protein [Chloroflexota bacterium]|nr:VWA domain-containing protein [Chloroflexota bacterium]